MGQQLLLDPACPVPCTLCDQSFSNPQELELHKLECHEDYSELLSNKLKRKRVGDKQGPATHAKQKGTQLESSTKQPGGDVERAGTQDAQEVIKQTEVGTIVNNLEKLKGVTTKGDVESTTTKGDVQSTATKGSAGVEQQHKAKTTLSTNVKQLEYKKLNSVQKWRIKQQYRADGRIDVFHLNRMKPSQLIEALKVGR
jgi:hypothetical protein